jgi:hypothetical protein
MFAVFSKDAGVASAMVNTMQQVGGSIGTALLSTIAASATTSQLVGHVPSRALISEAAISRVCDGVLVGGGDLRHRRRAVHSAALEPQSGGRGGRCRARLPRRASGRSGLGVG